MGRLIDLSEARADLQRAARRPGRPSPSGRGERERLELLAEVSTLLANSGDTEAKLQRIAQLAVPSLADWSFVYLLDSDGTGRRVAVAPDDTPRALLDAFPERLSQEAGSVLASLADSQPVVFSEIPLTTLRSIAVSNSHLLALQRLRARSALIAPLASGGCTLGVIGFLSTRSETSFEDSDRLVAEDLARRCAYALENARLYGEVILQRDKAENANRVKDEFLAILSHELRNPLVPILGWTRILKKRGITNDEVLLEGIRSLERNAHNIQRLVNDCIEFVRTSTRHINLELERIDMNQVIAASIESIMPLARAKGLRLDVRLSAGEIGIIGDRTRLEQLVVNLLTNAVKYTPSGSVDIRSSTRGREAIVEVRDTGVGIDPDFLETIFEPFRQATNSWLTSESGLGIGLTIAREIVQLHSGTIRVTSPGLDRGSTFTVSLPLDAGSVDWAPVDIPEPVEYSGDKTIRVLLVEDDKDVLFLMKQELEWAGYQVLAAGDGASALTLAARELPDIIVSDIKMPQIDGYEFVRQARQIPSLASVPAVAMTGFGMERDVERARQAGYDAHLIKPANIEQMHLLIQKLTNADFVSHADGFRLH